MECDHIVDSSLINLTLHHGDKHALAVDTPSLALAIEVANRADLVCEKSFIT